MVDPDEYDDIERRCLPYYEAFFGTILDFIDSDDKKILEFASGTGFLTEMIAEKYPDLDITCIDHDSGMLATAKRKPALLGVKFIKGDMRDEYPGKFDVIVITQAVFGISDLERKSFFEKVYSMLSNRGRFICGDMFSPEKDSEKIIYKKLWTEHMLKNGFTPEETADMLGQLDNYCGKNTVSSFICRLKESGFNEVISPYHSGYYGVVVAFK